MGGTPGGPSTALREALAGLEAEGLIERGARTGYFVPQMTDADVAEVMKLRLAFECLAIDEICTHAKVNLAPLTQATDEFERFHGGGYSLGVLEADRRFHEALVDAAQLRRLSALYHRAPLPLIHGKTEDQHAWSEACVRTLSEHRQILAALASRDAQHGPSACFARTSHCDIRFPCVTEQSVHSDAAGTAAASRSDVSASSRSAGALVSNRVRTGAVTNVTSAAIAQPQARAPDRVTAMPAAQPSSMPTIIAHPAHRHRPTATTMQLAAVPRTRRG